MHARRSSAAVLASALTLGTLLTFGAGMAQASESQEDSSSSQTVEGSPKFFDLGDTGRYVFGIGYNLF